MKTLSCEHKVYFNATFVPKHVHTQDTKGVAGKLGAIDGASVAT